MYFAFLFFLFGKEFSIKTHYDEHFDMIFIHNNASVHGLKQIEKSRRSFCSCLFYPITRLRHASDKRRENKSQKVKDALPRYSRPGQVSRLIILDKVDRLLGSEKVRISSKVWIERRRMRAWSGRGSQLAVLEALVGKVELF